MIQIIVQVSKYILLALMVFFTIETYMVLRNRSQRARDRIMGKQIFLLVVFNIVAYLVMFLKSADVTMLVLCGGVILYIVIMEIIYHLLYKRASMILLNTMCMLLSVGFIIQARLGIDYALKQLMIVAISSVIALFIPVFIQKVRIVRDLTWLYGIMGILLLGAVFLFSAVSRGANLSLTIGGISFQFSEFVKILIVFFMAGMLQDNPNFKKVLVVTVVAALEVGLLVLSRDLGAALIYFVAYIVMVTVATHKIRYAFLGLAGMAGASAAAYKLFSHIRVRVDVWRDPFADYQGTGYQIVQALFGVCAGGWFGTGLFCGSPDMIPLAIEDFTFAAICEELGILFGICLILLCMGLYLLIVNMAMRLGKPFYKLIAIGLGTEYAFQVFLTIGGTTKFIPMTGITLPLVSYGGSSVMCTIIMIAIVQGLYILRKDEDEQFEEDQRRRLREKNRQFEDERRREEQRQFTEEYEQSGQQTLDDIGQNIEKRADEILW